MIKWTVRKNIYDVQERNLLQNKYTYGLFQTLMDQSCISYIGHFVPEKNESAG